MGIEIREKMNAGFRNLQGGLFSSVQKADVGNALADLEANGVEMFCWADPFKPDKMLPDFIAEAAAAQIQSGNCAHYTAPVGDDILKRAIAKKLERQNGLSVTPERNILITPGSDSGLLFAMMPFLNPGDEVLVFDPGYPNNFLDPKLLGARTVPVMLRADAHYKIDMKALERAVTPRTKLVLLTNPNNPTGTVFSAEEMKELARFILRHDLVAVVDQAFEDFIYDGREMVTLAALPGMWERCVTVFSVSKGMALSGLRVGYLVADDAVMDVLYASAVNVIGATNTAFQQAVAEAFEHPEFLESYRALFEKRRKKVYEILSSIPRVRVEYPQSGYLSWMDVSAYGTAEEMTEYLKKEARVFVNAGTPYGRQGEGHLRIVHGCYADDERVFSAMRRIRDALLRYPGKGVALRKG